MKKVKLSLMVFAFSVGVVGAVAFTSVTQNERYFRNGVEITDTSPCEQPVTETCYDVYDETGMIHLGTVQGTWNE